MLQVLGLVNRIQPYLNGWFTVLQLFILLENFQLSGKPQPEPSNGTCPDSSRFFVYNLALSCQFRLRKSLWRSAACHHRVFPNAFSNQESHLHELHRHLCPNVDLKLEMRKTYSLISIFSFSHGS